MSDFENLISYWQNSLSVNLGIERKPAQHTEMHHLVIDQLNYSALTKMISFDAADLLIRSHLEEYEKCVDRISERKIINSELDYAECALKFAGCHKQNSNLWKSSLDAADALRNIDSLRSSTRRFATLDEEGINLIAKHLPAKFPSSTINAKNGNISALSESSSMKGEWRMQEEISRNFKRTLTSPDWGTSPKKANIEICHKALRQQASFGEVQSRKTNSEQNASKDEETKKHCGEMMTFKTAKQQYLKNQQKRLGQSNRSLFLTKNRPHQFVQPSKLSSKAVMDTKNETEVTTDDKLKHIDPKMIELMMSEIMEHGPSVTWDDIAGLEFVKATIKEIVIWPMLRPDLFTGLRGPPKGVLLFGPPGTGKTLIGKCIASQTKSTFFTISASSLTSKWIGEGEKLVKALFTVARCHQPAVIFIDEIDSLLTQRSESEHESSRRIKTEFLVQLDGATTSSNERLLIIGATNRPQELDEALRRRLVKRLYIPLPELEARRQIVKTLLKNHAHLLSDDDLDIICKNTDGYSGSDMANLCKEAALGPIRRLNFSDIEHINEDEVEPIVQKDFLDALKQVRASVSSKDLQCYVEWNEKFGSCAT